MLLGLTNLNQEMHVGVMILLLDAKATRFCERSMWVFCIVATVAACGAGFTVSRANGHTPLTVRRFLGDLPVAFPFYSHFAARPC